MRSSLNLRNVPKHHFCIILAHFYIETSCPPLPNHLHFVVCLSLIHTPQTLRKYSWLCTQGFRDYPCSAGDSTQCIILAVQSKDPYHSGPSPHFIFCIFPLEGGFSTWPNHFSLLNITLYYFIYLLFIYYLTLLAFRPHFYFHFLVTP